MKHYDPSMNIQRIFLIGAGGTGGHLARSIARILYDMSLRQMHVPSFTIVDPDTVSASNVGRQSYTVGDVGKPKATVLARRFNLALGLQIRAITAPFNPKRHVGQRTYSSLLIGAVDNAAARRSIAECQALTLDLGNHRSSGQVCLGDYFHDNQSECLRHSNEGQFRHLPNPYCVFPDLLVDEAPTPVDSKLSCAELVALSEQELLINDMMATSAATIIHRLLHRQPITHWLTFCSTEGPSINPIAVSLENIRHYGHIPKTAGKHAA